MELNSLIIILAILCSITLFSTIPNADAKTWKVHVLEMPKQWQEHFGDLYYEGTTYWEKRYPGTYFVQEFQREKADFVVQWSSQFQGTKLGYYTSSSNNDFGRPFIAITLGFMDDASVKFQDRKFNLVDAEYAKLITIHELGHAVGFAHSEDPNDIMYPTIYNYDDWVYKKQFGNFEVNVVTKYNSKALIKQIEANANVENSKEQIYLQQDLLYSKQYQSPDAQEKLNKAWTSLEEAKDYLGQAEWTQKEGENYLKTSDYEKAYFKYLNSLGMAKKVLDPIIEIGKAVESADKLESQYQEIKETEKMQEKPSEKKEEKTCFWIFCW